MDDEQGYPYFRKPPYSTPKKKKQREVNHHQDLVGLHTTAFQQDFTKFYHFRDYYSDWDEFIGGYGMIYGIYMALEVSEFDSEMIGLLWCDHYWDMQGGPPK